MIREDYELLVAMMPKQEKPPEYAVKLLEDTCARTGLDWKQRHLYLMSLGGKWSVTLSIDGFRKIGASDPDYAGQEGPFWVSAPDGVWSDIPPDGRVYAAKVGVKHRNGITTWGVAKFADYKAGPMWDKFPSTMSAKCAEMLAWRKAFPGSLGGLYGLEEMAQADKGAAEKVAQIAAGESKDPVEALEGDRDARKNSYLVRLQGATGADLKALGKAIASDSTLTHAAVLELHNVYQARKKDLGL